MSLYTPVFPSFHEPSSSRNGLPENTSVTAPGKQQSYVEFLRDVHLFLSTQNEVLSPPSRSNSPSSDYRVQQVRENVQDFLNATGGDSSNGKWTRISQTLQLGCVRGKPRSVSKADPCLSEEDTNWILPDAESEWIEWEKKREEKRRLKGKTNMSPEMGNPAPVVPHAQKFNHANVVKRGQRRTVPRDWLNRAVSPTTVRAAKEKVREWRASVASTTCYDTTSTSQPTSTKATMATTVTERLQRSRTLDFAVVKPAAKSIAGKMASDSVWHTAVQSSSAPTPLHKLKSSEPSSKASNIPQVTTPDNVGKTGSKGPQKTSIQGDVPKIANVPETPYLPPSFPVYLETSTPLPDSMMLVRAKPSPILPLPTPSPTTVNPPEDHQPIPAEPHTADVPSSLPPHINSAHPEKRSRELSMSVDGIPDDPLLAPSAKRLRTPTHDYSIPGSKHSTSMLPNGGLNGVPDTRDDAADPSLGATPSHQYNMDSLGMVSGAPLTPGKTDQLVTSASAQGFPEKMPSPTKSVRSYFSAPDSDLAESPMNGNLLLESPVSPMLSYARNPTSFLPQITSTQVGKGSPVASRRNSGVFGIGYSSQFDVERHVDRVNELLAKDVDLDGWLRDVRTVESGHD